MNTNALAKKLDVDARAIRHYARKHFKKQEGGWDFDAQQVKEITAHFKKLKDDKKNGSKDKQPIS